MINHVFEWPVCMENLIIIAGAVCAVFVFAFKPRWLTA